jgi:zinc/manganese transport system substrate-binding protein
MHRLLPLLFVVFAALSGLSARAADEKPLVVSTNTIAHDLVQQVAGDFVRAQCLLPAGSDPHGYEPKPADIRHVARADLVVVNGLGFESWIAKLVANSGFKGPVVTLAEGVTPLAGACTADHDHEHDHHHGELDPHAWQDVRNVIRYVENLRAALVALMPGHADALNTRAAAYTAELQAVHDHVTKTLAALPPGRRKLVTSHDALAYFGHAYGLTIVPIAGLSTEQEPNARQLAQLIRRIRAENVPAVFIESTSNPKLARLLASEAGVTVPPSLYTDSVGPAGSPAGTYLGMMRHNADTIAAALR